MLPFTKWTPDYSVDFDYNTETSSTITRSNEWSSIGNYSLKGTSTAVNIYNQFIGVIHEVLDDGTVKGMVTIHNPMTNAQLLLYNRTTQEISQVTIPKSDTPTMSSIESIITGTNVLEIRVRINPSEIGQYIYVDDFKLTLQ